MKEEIFVSRRRLPSASHMKLSIRDPATLLPSAGHFVLLPQIHHSVPYETTFLLHERFSLPYYRHLEG
jgi:hypothetical protein